MNKVSSFQILSITFLDWSDEIYTVHEASQSHGVCYFKGTFLLGTSSLFALVIRKNKVEPRSYHTDELNIVVRQLP